jgi:two-component system LytT family response regulator
MNETIKTIIIDDDPNSIRKLSDDLKNFTGIKVLDTATSVDKARKIIIDRQPDLLFLDVEMPGMSGIDLLREIQADIKPDMRIIFYTAHDKYFRSALLVSDFDYYLMKPYLPEELSAAIKRIRSKESKATIEQLLQKLIREKRFAIQTVTGIKTLTYDEVLFFEHPKGARIWQIRLIDREAPPCTLRPTVSAKDILAITPNFIQINQRCIINLTYLSHIGNKTLKCELNGYEVELELSPKYYAKTRNLLDVL